MLEINYWAVLVAALSSMVIGSLWYGPLFGKIWMEGMGWPTDKEGMAKMMAEGKTQMPLLYGQQLILSLVMAFVFAHVLWAFSVAPGMEGMSWFLSGLNGGFWMWLGFVFPLLYGTSLWSGKKFKYVSVELGYWLVLLLVMGWIISAWR